MSVGPELALMEEVAVGQVPAQFADFFCASRPKLHASGI
jgi:hypothetical protein